MNRMSIMPRTNPSPGVRVRVVYVKVKARRCVMAAIMLGAIAAALPFLFNSIASARWAVALFVPAALACAALSVFFFRTEKPQPRRVFDTA